MGDSMTDLGLLAGGLIVSFGPCSPVHSHLPVGFSVTVDSVNVKDLDLSIFGEGGVTGGMKPIKIPAMLDPIRADFSDDDRDVGASSLNRNRPALFWGIKPVSDLSFCAHFVNMDSAIGFNRELIDAGRRPRKNGL